LVSAQTSDPVAARGQLQQGFALKEQSKCNEAIPHFLESVRLDRQPKALLNLADCEEKLGKLGAAQTHFVEARELARAQGLDPLKAFAEQHLQAIEKRMPRLIVKLAPDAPTDTTVTRDGVSLGSVSLNSPLPIEVGAHVIIARGGGFQRQYEVTVAESETKELPVTPIGGEPVAKAPAPAPATTATTQKTATTTSGPVTVGVTEDLQTSDRPTRNGQRIAGFAAIGAGVVGLAVGTVFGLKVARKNDEIDATCPAPQPCPPDGVALYNSAVDDAKSARTLSIIGIGAGAALAAVGVTLVLTAPRSSSSGTGLWVAPAIANAGPGAAVGGTW
jgi:hypothetical protein